METGIAEGGGGKAWHTVTLYADDVSTLEAEGRWSKELDVLYNPDPETYASDYLRVQVEETPKTIGNPVIPGDEMTKVYVDFKNTTDWFTAETRDTLREAMKYCGSEESGYRFFFISSMVSKNSADGVLYSANPFAEHGVIYIADCSSQPYLPVDDSSTDGDLPVLKPIAELETESAGTQYAINITDKNGDRHNALFVYADDVMPVYDDAGKLTSTVATEAGHFYHLNWNSVAGKYSIGSEYTAAEMKVYEHTIADNTMMVAGATVKCDTTDPDAKPEWTQANICFNERIIRYILSANEPFTENPEKEYVEVIGRPTGYTLNRDYYYEKDESGQDKIFYTNYGGWM